MRSMKSIDWSGYERVVRQTLMVQLHHLVLWNKIQTWKLSKNLRIIQVKREKKKLRWLLLECVKQTKIVGLKKGKLFYLPGHKCKSKNNN